MEYCPLEFQSGCAITTSRLGCRWIDSKEGEGEMMSIRLCVDTRCFVVDYVKQRTSTLVRVEYSY